MVKLNVFIVFLLFIGLKQTQYNPDSCLITDEEAKEKIKEIYGYEDDSKINNKTKFILGRCYPILLIPGLWSTKLSLELNCSKLYKEDIDIYKKIKFYCPYNNICNDISKTYEEHFLYNSYSDEFNLKDNNKMKYHTCLSFFFSMYNNGESCGKDENKNICLSSDAIKIGFKGFTKSEIANNKCGAAGTYSYSAKSMKGFYEQFTDKGYDYGFNLDVLTYDYRQKPTLNKYFSDAFKYHIDRLYNQTGKKVIIYAHSMGNVMTLTNLLKSENQYLIPKIKKYLAMAPPYLGGAGSIDHIIRNNPFFNKPLSFFGTGLIYRKFQSILDLSPHQSISDIFKKDDKLAEAIKERINLEDKCFTKGNENCTDDYISNHSSKFNELFEEKYPSFTEEDCKDKDYEYSDDLYARKCNTNMYNLLECPIIITTNKNDDDQKEMDDVSSFCNKDTKDEFYYQTKCGNDNPKSCLFDFYESNFFYPFGDEVAKKFYLEYYNNYTAKKYNWENISEKELSKYFMTEEELKKIGKTQLIYDQNNLSEDYESLTIPPVDTDIFYISYVNTEVSIIYDIRDLNSSKTRFIKKGGDIAVESSSVLIPYFKWKYELKKNKELKQKINLLEVCSRLGSESKYKYYSEGNNHNYDFIALDCDAIKNGQIDKNELLKISHTTMLIESHLKKYVSNVFNNPNEDIQLDENIKAAVKYFDPKKNYEQTCNKEISNLLRPLIEDSPKEDETSKESGKSKEDKKNDSILIIIGVVFAVIIIIILVLSIIIIRKKKNKSDESKEPLTLEPLPVE